MFERQIPAVSLSVIESDNSAAMGRRFSGGFCHRLGPTMKPTCMAAPLRPVGLIMPAHRQAPNTGGLAYLHIEFHRNTP
ncbi:hypothetical protein GOODEAATRI_031033 [Goodea atripinnis]|uniref:Uncharacterized protein n=1 Tax=Goodea atripinnis TaxID=208336 RepID=A0ABV0NHI9_9TELE